MPIDPAITCPECGLELPRGTPPTQCPNCLLGLGLVEARAGFRDREEGRGQEPGGLPAMGDYELLEEIGRGGMGVVYKARQKSLDRIVALKLLMFGPHASPESVKRFRAEAVATAALQHPNIVAIHEVGFCAGQHFLVMDFVEGRSLARVISDSRFQLSDLKRAASYVKAIAEAIHYAHERGVLHRDLKPSNILIDAHDQPRVTDFGLARRLEGESELTLSGQVLGSPNYMPPEQARGKRGRVSRRSDVYALGAMLYHALTGRPPFAGESLADTVRQVMNEDPMSPRTFNPRLPADLETICLKCMEKDPARRYATAQALEEELGRFLEGKPVLARPVGRVTKALRWCRRNPRLAGALGAALLSLLLGLAGTTWQWRHAAAERGRAEAEGSLARRNAYAADMNLALRALEETDLGRAREVLNRYRPGASAEIRMQNTELDLRGWEWRYLWGRCRSDEHFTLCQYSNAVTALAFSPDGKWLAVRRKNGSVVLWDTIAKRSVTEWRGAGWYKALAFSPQGDLLAWGGENSGSAPAACVRNVATREEIARLPLANELVSIAFSPDARELATLDYSGTVSVWNLEAKALSTSLRVEPIDPFPVRIAGRGETATSVAKSASGPPGVEARPSRPRLNQSKILTDHYGCVGFSPDGRWLAVGEGIPQIRLFERATGIQKIIQVPDDPADGITALAFSPDSRLLAAGCGAEENEIHVWELAQALRGLDGSGRAAISGAPMHLGGHTGWIAALAFSPDGQTLASASADQTLRLWDVPCKVELGKSGTAAAEFISTGEHRRFQGHVDEVWALAWGWDGKHLVTGGKDGSVRYWDPAAKGVAPFVVLAEPIHFWGPTFLPDSRTFLAATLREGAVTRWDAITGKKLETLAFLGTGHRSVDLSSGGRWLALSQRQGTVQVWDFPARRMVTNLVAGAPAVFAVIFAAGGAVLSAGAMDSNGRVVTRFWTQPGWRELDLGLNLRAGHISDAALPRNSRTFAVGYGDGTAALWDIFTGRRKALFECGYDIGAVVALSDDEARFATASYNGPVTLWDATGRRLWSIARAHRNALHELAFSPDGRRLAALGTSPKGPVMIWDVQTGRDVATLPGETRWYNHAGFSPDGNTLFACSIAGPALLYHAPSPEEIEAAEKPKAGP